MIVDLAKNPKQEEYIKQVLARCVNKNEFNYFAYGGAIRGGKTFATLALLTLLCKKYPGSRWVIVRKDFPALETTTIPSFEKIIFGSKNWRANRKSSNYYYAHSNGSRIFFKAESLKDDPELNDFLGLEANGFFLEQAEELSEKMWGKALERSGSWYIDPMPPAFIFLTFNPTQTWVKEKFYEPWVKGELKSPYYFQSALPKDNAFVTQDQWSAWGNMADTYYRQFIEGDWSDMSDQTNRWAFAYSPVKHRATPELNYHHPVYLSFDFNVNPMCCSVIQHYGGVIRVLETIKLPNSGTEQICEHILASPYRKNPFIITGDATGSRGDAAQHDNMNNYLIIQKKLRLSMNQFKVPTINPRIEHNRVLVNSILQNYKVEIHTEKAKALHFDLANAKIHPDGTLIKENRKDPTQQLDSLDTFRYWCNMFMSDFLRL